MSTQINPRNQTLREKVDDLFARGGYKAERTIRRDGIPEQVAAVFASTDKMWFDVRFEQNCDRRMFTIGVGDKSNRKPKGHIGFKMGSDGQITEVGASIGIDINMCLKEFGQSHYDATRTEDEIKRYRPHDETDCLSWNVNRIK